MATRRKPREKTPRDDIDPTSPAQEDESDILAEAGGETDEETGETVLNEDEIQRLGAVDATSVRENRRNQDLVNKKRGNVKNVSFNTGDALTTYDNVVKAWPANTLDINVKRLTGVPVTRVLTSRPRSGTELYQALLIVHGQYDEAEYEIRCVDTVHKQFRATTRIWMPDTRLSPQQQAQQGQPMPYYPQPSPGYQPPPGYAPPAPVAAPAPLPPSAGPDLQALVGVFQHLLEMTKQPAPPVAPATPPSDAQALLQAFKQMLEGNRSASPPPTVVPETPPGMIWIEQLKTFVSIEDLARAVAPPPEPVRPPPQQYRPPEQQYPSYGPPGARPLRPPPPGGGGSYYQQQQRPQTPTDQLKDAMGTLRAAMSVMKEFSSIMPDASGGYDAPSEREQGIVPASDEESPIRIIDTGHGKLAMGRDGKFRLQESIFANLDGIMKFVGDNAEAIQRRAQQQRQPQQQQRQQLPPGYVEVGPGYQPPAGYQAVPVDPSELPPPPDPLPPAISGPRSWGMPPIPEG